MEPHDSRQLSPSLPVQRLALTLKRPTHRSIVNFCARLLLGLVLVIAAVSKSVDLNQFAQRVGDFGLVHDALVTPSAFVIVLAELLSGLALILRLRGSLACAVALLLLFVSVLAHGITLGLDVECGCFGPDIHISLETQLLTDLGLLSACVIIYLSDEPKTRGRVAFNAPKNPNISDSP